MHESAAVLEVPDGPPALVCDASASGALDTPAPDHVHPEPLSLVPSDERATTFEAFFRAEYPNLLRAMYLVCGGRHEAEEITQDAFVRAYERWDLVLRADNRAGYLYRIALNLYRSKLRRAAVAARKVVKPSPPRDEFEATDDRDAIGRALKQLTRAQREAVVLVEWMGMTDDEAGAMLGISPITVRVRIHRARTTLRPILERGANE
jgi:RNA polymerase sigma-70 factor (ECF subfamily)